MKDKPLLLLENEGLTPGPSGRATYDGHHIGMFVFGFGCHSGLWEATIGLHFTGVTDRTEPVRELIHPREVRFDAQGNA